MVRIGILVMLLFLLGTVGWAQERFAGMEREVRKDLLADESSGDEKIKDTKKEIGESVNEDNSDQEKSNDESKTRPTAEDSSNDQSPGGQLFLAILQIMMEYTFTARYAMYPYENGTYVYNTSVVDQPTEKKLFSVDFSSEAAWHVDSTFGEVNKVCFRFLGLNINLFNQFIFAGSEGFRALSANGGLCFFVPNFQLDLYVGIFRLDFVDRAFLSFGTQFQLFFHDRVYFEVYNLNSYYMGLEFSYVSGCLNYAFGRWGIGAGFNYSNYNGFEYLGPLIKLSLWF
ncbi:MAG TPA: hypothetical protein VMV03_05250 [Spirochaetia bacterium]|nr:hypothetical protein [Spirochaetia bacterium]